MTTLVNVFMLVFCYLCFANTVKSIRILCVYPVPFHSHQFVFRVLTEELSERGHELVVLTPLPYKQYTKNVTEIDVQDLSFSIFEKVFKETIKSHKGFSYGPLEFWEEVVYPTIFSVVDAQFSTKEMQAILHDENQHFDVILVEACVPLSLLVAARFKAPVIQVSSFFGSDESFETVGAATHPWILPEWIIQKIYNLSFWEKLSVVFTYFKLIILRWHAEKIENGVIRKHLGPEAPTIRDLRKKVKMLFLNVHHIWDNHRPVPPSVLYMGALQVKKPKPLPKDLQSYLESSRHGVIYMSLGSKVRASDLPTDTVNVFLKVFGSLPYDVIMKWNGDDMEGKPGNVRLEEWLPQNDLLHHPKVKAFITQCGLQSTDEAIAAKVPLIGLPVIADQFYNAHKYLEHQIGVQLDINHVREDDLREAILSVAEDPSYRSNLAKLSRIMEEQRRGGLEKAVYWTEYVSRHGADHLSSPLAHSSFTERYLLYIFTKVFVALVLFSAVMYFVATVVMGKLCCSLANRKWKLD